MDNKFRISTISLSENPQTVYCYRKFCMIKPCNHKSLMTVFVYNYVILKYSVLIFLDLKEMATVYFRPFHLLCVEITGMLII